MQSSGSRKGFDFWGEFYCYQREDCTCLESVATQHTPTGGGKPVVTCLSLRVFASHTETYFSLQFLLFAIFFLKRMIYQVKNQQHQRILQRY